MKWWPSECVPGDMIRVSVGSVLHYGIFVSEDEIIQFGPPPDLRATVKDADVTVCVTDIDGFSRGTIVEKAVLTRSEQRTRLSLDDTVARARVGEHGYSLLHNNCEHFAYECVFGKKQSTQEENARRRWANRPILDVYIAPIPDEVPVVPIACRAREEQIRKTSNPVLAAARRFDWQVLLYAAERSFCLSENDLHFQKSIDGKWTCHEFFLSLSHTDGAVLVGVSNSLVGVDIENVRSFVQKPYVDRSFLQRLLQRIQSPGEQTSPEKDDVLSLWLKKESLFKCSGKRFAPVSLDTTRAPIGVYSLPSEPDLRLAVCGEKLPFLKLYRYEAGTARLLFDYVTEKVTLI